MGKLTHLIILNLCFISSSIFSNGGATDRDTLAQQRPITGSETLVSKSETFELGFFSPSNSGNLHYLGIWYKNISPRTVVWVANRDAPIMNSSSVSLHLNNTGNIVLLDQFQNPIWASSSNRYLKPGRPIAQLLDSGNLVVREEIDENQENYLWQSFDYPTNTLMPGMRLGWDLKTGRNRFLTSWRKSDDPSMGEYSFEIDRNGSPEAYLLKGETRLYRSGPWNGIQFSGVPEMLPNEDLRFEFVSNETEISYSFSLTHNASTVSRLFLDESGVLRRLVWLNRTQKWNLYWFAPKDQCDGYSACGAYGICDSNRAPICKCPKGFKPKNQFEWDLRDGSDGCVMKREEMDCREGNVGFLKLERMKLAVSEKAFVDSKMGLKECEEKCRRNCSCTGFANSDIQGRGCIMWSGDLIDLREYSFGGQDLYVRVDASELKKDRRPIYIIVAVAVSLTILLFALGAFFVWKYKIAERWWKRKEGRVGKIKSQEMPLFDVFISSSRECLDDSKKDDLELQLFDFDTIASSTNNFSEVNTLGQGGFGCVYKGILADGQQIAVKRLSKNSGQGVEELKNEVTLIARLQHRNLVRLLGCCIEEKENLLIYEYMENRSLDSILFDKTRSMLLDWPKRFNIILGTARGLLYLHRDSRFRIIHRDLKASNILLDGEMNPKISDFGMARIFGGDQTEANTRRVVGTYGYMSPEYAMDGIFSVKSDVFSYGVLLLEIVSGKKNQGFYHPDSDLNLLGHTWNLWEEGKGLDLMDVTMEDSCSATEVLKCIHVGLLCVQERAEDRPTMDSVVLMLNSEVPKLLQPKQPGFCLGKTPTEINSSLSKQQTYTVNQVTVTVMQPR